MNEYPHVVSLFAWIQHRGGILFLRDNENVLNQQILTEIILRFTNDKIPKINDYMEIISSFEDATFRLYFRMRRLTFAKVVNYLGPFWVISIKRNEEEGGNKQIPLDKSLLICLWVIATPDRYRSIAERFSVGKSTVYNSLITIVYLVNLHLCPKFIKFPTANQKNEIATCFERRYRFPNVIGCIDGCHIPIKKPVVHGNDYFNRKKFYSVVLQGICKHNLSFIDVDCRWPGSVHDARVLRTSPIYELSENFCHPNYFILGDSAYPCTRWLLCPFKNNGFLTNPQKHFNTALSQTRVAIENAFALLKGRFRRLKYLEMYDIGELVNTVIACCTLHNICIAEDEEVEQFLQEGADVEAIHEADDFRGNHEQQNQENHRNIVIEYLWKLRNN